MADPSSDMDVIIPNYTHYLILPLKFVACWEWYKNPTKDYQIIINNVYLAFVLFVLLNLPFTLAVHLYTEWVSVMESLEKLADGLPILVSVAIVVYFATHRQQLYELVDYMNDNFKYHSAQGLTNMTMRESYERAKRFALVYTACTLFSVTMYTLGPIVVYLWSRQPMQQWVYKDVNQMSFFIVVFLRQAVGQAFVGLAMGQLGVLFATNAILLCGQYDLLCCSLRNARYTALLRRGVAHESIARQHADILLDERFNYIYNRAQMVESQWHYDEPVVAADAGRISQFDIYSPSYEEASCAALRDCARVCQIAAEYKQLFERFVSPLLALRVVQVTLYLCTLLYAATEKFEMITVEYLAAVALDIFVYCYFGNQIILQASRVSRAGYQCVWAAMGGRARRLLLNVLLSARRPVTVRAGNFLPMDLHTFVVASRVSRAGYQCVWAAMGGRARRLLLNVLLSARRPVTVRAGNFLPMDLHTFVVIIKTSFSYYTLLVNVNEKKKI